MRRRISILASGVLAAMVALVLPSPVAAAAPHPTEYAALGDSYAAGVGAGGESGSCRRSPNAYPELVARSTRLTLKFVACFGAKIPDLANGQSQVLHGSTALVTITIGGNDAGFAPALAKCIASSSLCSGAIAAAENFIHSGRFGQELSGLFGELRHLAANARFVVVGYPHLFAPSTRTCALIRPRDQVGINRVADGMADAEHGAAILRGMRFVDGRSVFAGHELCTQHPWIRGISNPIQLSFHPTANGQVAYGFAALAAAR